MEERGGICGKKSKNIPPNNFFPAEEHVLFTEILNAGFSCEICKNIFTRKSDVREHIQNKHKNSIIKYFRKEATDLISQHHTYIEWSNQITHLFVDHSKKNNLFKNSSSRKKLILKENYEFKKKSIHNIGRSE